MSWADLEAEIRTKRDVGVVTMFTVSRPQGMPARDVADHVAKSAHYKPIGDLWVPLSPDQAGQLLQDILARDLAYGAVLMPSADASRLGAGFLAHVGDGAEFFTNVSWKGLPVVTPSSVRGPMYRAPLSGATFDSGVVGVGDNCAAIVWVEDED